MSATSSSDPRDWYGSSRWKRRRLDQLSTDPFCVMCLEQSGVYTVATVADHLTPHRGDARLFWNGRLQSLCASHHNRDKQLAEIGRPLLGVDDDGWPRMAGSDEKRGRL
jgi:5-methylcytosine-specific restriction endonuclease McrA